MTFAGGSERVRVPSSAEARREGLTLVELAIVVAIIGLLGAIAIPSYIGHAKRAKVRQAIADIRSIEFAISSYVNEYGQPPNDLTWAADRIPMDPWGNAYRYLNLQSGDPGINGKRRRDKNLNPVNSDYDLYSRGPDGETSAQLNAKKARDDIVRAADGRFVGIAEEF